MTSALIVTLFNIIIEFGQFAEEIFTTPVPNLLSEFIIEHGKWLQLAVFPIGSINLELAEKLSKILGELVGNMTVFEFFLIPGFVFFVVYTLFKWIFPVF